MRGYAIERIQAAEAALESAFLRDMPARDEFRSTGVRVECPCLAIGDCREGPRLRGGTLLKLYDSTVSGNCYKVRLLLAQLNRPYEKVEVDVVNRGGRPADLMRQNPAGRVPLLILDDGRALPESNAILWHLAQGTAYLPGDPFQVTQVLQWMFFEQNLLEPNVGTARYWVSILKQPEKFVQPLEIRRASGNAALRAMQSHLAENEFFVAGRYTIADIALFGYAHVAGEGGFDLVAYPAVSRWIDRVRQQPGHVPLSSQAD